MEEHENFGIEESGADAVVIALKKAQLFILPSILGKQPLRMTFGHKGVVSSMT